MAINWTYNVQQVYIESYVTNLSLHLVEYLHGWPRHLSTQSVKWGHHDVFSSEIFADEFPDKHPRDWMKQALMTWEEAMEVYMVKVTAKSHF